MNAPSNDLRCDQAELISAFALGVLPPGERAMAETHLADCPQCQQDADALYRVIGSFAAWPTDVLRPVKPLWDRLLDRIGKPEQHASPYPLERWSEPPWEDVAPGTSCKVLSTDTERDRVAMLVRLAPGASYPAHIHSGAEELHLLAGELWIDETKLSPGHSHRAEAGTSDQRVWSETGCTCLLMTSPSDVLV